MFNGLPHINLQNFYNDNVDDNEAVSWALYKD